MDSLPSARCQNLVRKESKVSQTSWRNSWKPFSTFKSWNQLPQNRLEYINIFFVIQLYCLEKPVQWFYVVSIYLPPNKCLFVVLFNSENSLYLYTFIFISAKHYLISQGLVCVRVFLVSKLNSTENAAPGNNLFVTSSNFLRGQDQGNSGENKLRPRCRLMS